MTEHRWKLWRSYLKAGRVRYRTAEFRCQDVTCQRWHAVSGHRSYGSYETGEQTLEDKTLDAMRTSATHGCQHARQPPKKKQEVPKGEGPEAATDAKEPSMKNDRTDDNALYIEGEAR
ncbi:MAG: hypothetical protein ACYTAN_12730 [Planctomycetota bacterium]